MPAAKTAMKTDGEKEMKTVKLLKKTVSLILPIALILGGCAGKAPSVDQSTQDGKESPVSIADGTTTDSSLETQTDASGGRVSGLPFDFQVNPKNFELTMETGGTLLTVSQGGKEREYSDYQEKDGTVSWRYPGEGTSVAITPAEDYLSVTITSETEEDNTFVWPEISGETYYFPFGEGKRVPAGDSVFREYLNGQEFSVLEQLSMPFWITSSGEFSILYIVEDPFRTNLQFSADPAITLSVSHDYPAIDRSRFSSYRIYLTGPDPVSAARLYRNYRMEQGDFMTLEQKAQSNPDIRKLYGAPFIYLWGEFLISPEDIDWKAFRQAADSPLTEYLSSFAGSQENGSEFTAALEEIKKQDYVAEYQKNTVCSYLSQLLKREDFWDPSVFTQHSPAMTQLLAKGYENLTETEKIQVKKEALAVNWPEIFTDAKQWTDSGTTELLQGLKESGIDRAWIGLNSWEQAYAKPELVEKAAAQGYLIGSYDSYHSIHEPGKEQWITAQFEDTALYEEATVTDKNGEKVGGFQNVGRKLNPVLAFPAVEARMEDIMSNSLPFNSWFIDCDATGEIYDDYSPSHPATQEEDLAARLERMAYIRDQYRFVVGSEGGNDFAASTIAFAHGIELKTFSWMDDDMKKNRDSEYYIGKYYNPAGGVAEHFSKRIPVKDKYYTLFVDPRYDIPLYKLVYNDSVITGYHWDWSTFKIQGATADRMVREVLYNVPPLYHLDAAEWKRYQKDIAAHHAVWSEFSRKAVLQEMTDFKYLTQDGAVQKTVYGENIAAVANFAEEAYEYEGNSIPGHSVWIQMDGKSMIYTPSLQPGNA